MPDPKPTLVEVLIIGAGPSGLMLATWLARYGIVTRVVEKRSTKIYTGQADGLQSRTLEIFDSLDIGMDIWREANHMLEICFWSPNGKGSISRSDRVVDTIPGLSRFQQATLHQGMWPQSTCGNHCNWFANFGIPGRIEHFLTTYISKYSNISVERGVIPESLSIDEAQIEDDDSYPITVTLKHLDEKDSTPSDSSSAPGIVTDGASVPNGLFRSNLAADDTDCLLHKVDAQPKETIKAKYMVGCDGAHSWTRRQLGITMDGSRTDHIWGVMDIVPITDFPDIRYRCAIHSESFGSMMIIPRENKLVRMYIQIKETKDSGGVVERAKINLEEISNSARKILSPYTLDYHHIHWWTVYQIGQRVGSRFSAHDRVFLAGDAVHTHSPKAGQGMNVSMHDTYNLGWKLATVIRKTADRSILKTYESERRKVAQDLIDFDHRLSSLFSGRPAKDVLDTGGIDLHHFKEVFTQGNLFASGIATDYGSSILVSKPTDSPATHGDESDEAYVTTKAGLAKKSLATGIKIGMRMPSFKVLNQSDARPWHFQELLKSNGSWRIVVFPGCISDSPTFTRYQNLGARLAKPDSFFSRYSPRKGREGLGIELLTVHSAPRTNIELLDTHKAYHPFSETDGWDYNKVFVDDQSWHEGHGHAYEGYGIDPGRGCVVIIRPDQYVSWIGDLEDDGEMETFFSAFMMESK